MNQVIFMRHSKAEFTGAVSDPNRELTPAGRKKATDFANKLLKKDIIVDLCIASEAERALLTAKIVAEKLELPQERLIIDPELYNASLREIMGIINALPSTCHSVLIVGHEPTMSFSAQALSAKDAPDRKALDAGFSTANGAIVKCSKPFSEWELYCATKLKLITVD